MFNLGLCGTPYIEPVSYTHLDVYKRQDNKVVLISDESHHINTRTKKLSKTEEAEENSWEYSVERIFRANRDNVLLEFTATADLKDPNVRRKYLDKIIFDYPLAKFRASGYTKDFQNLQSDTNPVSYTHLDVYKRQT